jgi:hypothetical protein
MAIIAPIVSTFDNKGIRRAESGFKDFSRKVGRSLANVAKASAAIGVGVGAAAFKAVQSASDLAEATAATEQIFGDAADAVLAFSESAATAFGQSKQAALEGAQIFGTFGKAAGLAGDDLSDFTTGLLGLASDIGSFRNASPEEVIEAIGAGLRGEAEPLRRFGVLLDDATLKAEAMALGIYSGNKPLTQQQKILAAEAVIYKQTADAQGDFQRTSDGLANSQRILAARFSNVIATLGEKLLPVALTVSNFFLDKVIPTIESLADTFSKDGLLGVLDRVWEWVKEYGPKVGEQFLEWGGALVGWIADNAGPAIDQLGKWLESVGLWITETGWPYVRDHFGEWTQATWDWITEDVLPELSGWLDGITGWVDENYTKVEEAFKDLRPALWNWITGAEVDEETKSAATDFASSLGGFLVEAIETSEAFTDELNKTFLTVIGAGLAKALIAVGILTREDVAAIPMAWTKVKEVVAGWYNAGKEMASILVDGIIAVFTDNSVVNTITGAIGGFYKGVGGLLGTLFGPSVELIGSNLGQQFSQFKNGVDFITGDTDYDMPDFLGMLPGMVPINVTNVNVSGALDPEAVGTQINDLLTQHYQRTGAVPTFL